MKTSTLTRIAPILAFGGFLSTGLQAQRFSNLGFDSPDYGSLVTMPNGVFRGPSSSVIPEWSLTVAGHPFDGLADIGDAADQYSRFRLVPTVGNQGYALGIWSGSPPFPASALSIGQTGQVPIDARGLVFQFSSGKESLDVAVNGTLLPKWKFQQNDFYIVDMSAYSGKSISLRFDFDIAQAATFDVVGFTQVPEPPVLAYSLVGLFLLCVSVLRQTTTTLEPKSRKDASDSQASS
jgi:hypothetical protein